MKMRILGFAPLAALALISAPCAALPSNEGFGGEIWAARTAADLNLAVKTTKTERAAEKSKVAKKLPRRQAPGLYHGPYYGAPRCSYDEDGYEFDCDVNYLTLEGQVGWPFYASPLAKCVGGTWTLSSAAVVWGALPPGLWMNDQSQITGTPQGPGTWHFTVEFRGVTCAGSNYGNRIQYLTIKTGSPTHPPYPGSPQ